MENVLGTEDELAASLSQLRARQGHSERPSCSHHDPSADLYIDFGAQPAYPMDQAETKMMVMKRKVLRHRPDGRVEVFDESQNAKPWSLGHRSTYVDDAIAEEEIGTSSGTLENYQHYDDDQLPEDHPYSLLGDFGSDTISEYSIPGRAPTTYIAPQAVRQKRTDPVAKLNGYKQDWERFTIPGQDTHQGLRWAARRQMQLPEDHPYSLLEDFGSDTISEYSIPGRAPTTYIAPQAVRQKRTDPVAKLNGYKQDWERFTIPGQDTHQGLRWAVRRQMQLPEDHPYSLLGDFGSDTISEYSIPGRAPTTYIAPQAVRQKRTDPVAKLNGYKQDWERFTIPGQDTHQGLRWAVRRQMQQSGLPRRAQKHLVPNMYEVPTMKKRDSLRFGVRWDLAHRLMPRRNSSS